LKTVLNGSNRTQTGTDLLKQEQMGSNRLTPDQTGSNLLKPDQNISNRFSLAQTGLIWVLTISNQARPAQ
ncbi:hypothetical protein CPC197_1805, partial [Chlamydia psittaci C1/97]